MVVAAPLTINIGAIAQTTTFGAQASPIAFSASGAIAISPLRPAARLATRSSTARTPSVCSVSGWRSPGSPPVSAPRRQPGGNGIYSAAPGNTERFHHGIARPPTIGRVAGNTQATVNFTAPGIPAVADQRLRSTATASAPVAERRQSPSAAC
jgi:hypothetical protein